MLAALLAALLGGCAALGAPAYEDVSHTTMADADTTPATGAPRLVESSGDPKMDVFLMLDQGYAVIGRSPFVGSVQEPTSVLDEARRAGAGLVVVGGRYRGDEAADTSYIRYDVARYDRWALYFAPLPRTGLGVLLDRMSERQRQAAHGAGGLQVIAIRKGSPAARNDIVIGDVILAIDGRPVRDLQSYRAAIAAARGGNAALELLRDGKRRSLTLNLSAW